MIVVWILAAALLMGSVFLFNRLIGLKNRAQGSWSDIDVQLKRRHDLIQNLVETIKGYAAHERQVLEEVTRLRNRAEEARTAGLPARTGAAESALTGRIPGLLALAEAYPDLKASERFLDLQKALVQVENDLQNARRYYNAVVRDLNTRIQSVPDLVIAGAFRFHEREFFDLEDPSEAVAPKINLDQ